MPLQDLMLPEIFQGKNATPPYFEGWYFRLQNGMSSISLIPGICLEPRPHAYIQYLNAERKHSAYWEYPIGDFHFDPNHFEIFIGKNIFSAEYIHLDTSLLFGEVFFRERVPFSSHRLNTGMMGPFAFLPFMQCNHGVVTIHSKLNGSLTDESGTADFTGGIGYIEKDWGKAFPQPYLWTQAHFADSTFMLCLARVPTPVGSITGILSFLYTKGQRYLFATYTGARLSSICRTEDGALHLDICTPHHRLFVRLRARGGLSLRAPGTHGMDRAIYEDPNAAITVRLATLCGRTICQGHSTHAGAEVVGDILSLKQ
ncbi:tocopherol cyclase family protein [Ethanoligenens harbinense]|uniref:Tocopherol cyclase n=1 Tax=Ethanoligenens harbinense (strain DSM 18485 / JCM 12961 / CGMCC 1.5033 / YUAN-3) TaxID=663278 RepID=E6U6U4_ETHHY|nr:tocopherol cyclase family protein [Ethanoligenens harbinense]ADU26911.1 hypothetical protein Ethha_1373 [Ethanoligenens harbinense YUAN-3]